MADRPPIYKKSSDTDEDESAGWRHFKTGRALPEKVGSRRAIDGREHEAVGHLKEDPEEFRSLADDEGHSAGSGTLKGKAFDRTTNDGILWREVKEKPTS